MNLYLYSYDQELIIQNLIISFNSTSESKLNKYGNKSNNMNSFMSYTWVSADKLVLLCPILSSHGNVRDLAEPFCYHLCTAHSDSVLTLYLDSATKIATC